MSLNQVNIFILLQKEELEIKTHMFKRKHVISMAAKVSSFFAEGWGKFYNAYLWLPVDHT